MSPRAALAVSYCAGLAPEGLQPRTGASATATSRAGINLWSFILSFISFPSATERLVEGDLAGEFVVLGLEQFLLPVVKVLLRGQHVQIRVLTLAIAQVREFEA